MRPDRFELEAARGYTPVDVGARPTDPAARAHLAPAPSLSRALASLTLLLALRATLAPWLGAGGALTVGLLGALAPLLAHRNGGDPRRIVPELEPCALGVTLGFLLLPMMLLPVREVGLALELGDEPFDAVPLGAGSLWLSGVLLGPVWEELLFRGLLMRALAACLGAAPALLGVTALSLICHAGPWSALVGAAAALVFGLVMLASDSLALCIGLHAGLNLAALAGGLAPFRDPVPLLALPPLSPPVAVAALWLARAHLRNPDRARAKDPGRSQGVRAQR